MMFDVAVGDDVIITDCDLVFHPSINELSLETPYESEELYYAWKDARSNDLVKLTVLGDVDIPDLWVDMDSVCMSDGCMSFFMSPVFQDMFPAWVEALHSAVTAESESVPTITVIGDTHWLKDGVLHREDGPAIERSDGYKAWYVNGELHRTDGPAIEYANGDKVWYVNGECHRIGGPVVVYVDGSREWCINGERHRIDGPAVERADDCKAGELS